MGIRYIDTTTDEGRMSIARKLVEGRNDAIERGVSPEHADCQLMARIQVCIQQSIDYGRAETPVKFPFLR